MKKILSLTISFVLLSLLVSGQAIYNDGGRITSTSGAYLVVDNAGFTFTSTNSTNPATLANLSIADDASLTIPAGSYLSLSGNLSNSAGSSGLTLQSDATGTASLIVGGSSSGTATTKRYATKDMWHYFASPVSGQNIDNTWMSANNVVNTPPYQFFRWDEELAYWINYESTGDPEAFTDATFLDAKGYIATRTDDAAYTFSGNIRTSAVNYSASYNANTGGGFHLIGNPFTSTIAINEDAQATDNFLADNTGILDNNYEAIYVWQEESDYVYERNDYKVICNTGFSGEGTEIDADYVQPGQAFIVKVDQTADIVFNTDIRKHGSADYYKAKESWPGLQLRIAGNEQVNSTIIAFHPYMTTGLDPSYDVVKFKGNPNLALYTKLIDDNGKDFAVQALPDLNIEDYIIPVGVDVAESGVFEFSVYQENLDNYNIILEDRRENTFTNLRWDTYFTTISESGTGRFYLHFKDATAIGEPLPQTNISFRYQDGKILISNPDEEKGTISVVNISGQVLARKEFNGNMNQEFRMQQAVGIYVVRVQTKKSVFSRKMFVK